MQPKGTHRPVGVLKPASAAAVASCAHAAAFAPQLALVATSRGTTAALLTCNKIARSSLRAFTGWQSGLFI